MRPQVDILLRTDQSNDVVGIVELSVPPGWRVFAPRGMIHTLANLAQRQARYPLVCTPGQFTRYFEQFSATRPPIRPHRRDKRYTETTVVGPTIPERLSRAP
jgi:hypothetical protein